MTLDISKERSNRSFTDFNDLRQRVEDISDTDVQSLQNVGFYVEMITVVSEITNRGHGTKQVLDRFTTWIVLTTVCPGRQSDVYRPEPKLSPVSMVIYTSAYHVTILLKNLKNEGLEEPQDVVLKEW